MLAVLEAPMPKSDNVPYWSGGRVRHSLTHFLCCILGNSGPGSCMNDPFEDDRGIKHAYANGKEDVWCIKADLVTAWKQRKGLERKAVRSFVTIGPRERLESDEEWYDRRLIWWVTHRMEFANLPAEVLLDMADDATNHMAYDLNHQKRVD